MKKKTFMAAVTISGLLLSLFGPQIILLSSANPFAFIPIEPPADSEPAIITIISPKDLTLVSSASFTLEFTITAPQTQNNYNMEEIREIYFTTDWQNQATFVRHDISPYKGSPPPGEPVGNYVSYSCTLSNVSEGQHLIQIHAHCSFSFVNSTNTLYPYFFFLNSSSVTHFGTSDMIPPEPLAKIANLQVENITSQGDAAVFFNTNRSASLMWMGYSLDSQANVTIYGNFTLKGLSQGPHSLIVYATDNAKTSWNSGFVQFDVTPSTPAPTNEPSPSPTTEPAPSPSVPEFPTWTILPLILVAFAGVLVFVRRRRTD